MDIQLTAQKIVRSYIDNGKDMNESIAKTASEKNLNLEQTKRLIEECNQNCYLTKFASTGEQVFDIADLNKVKEFLSPKEELKKEASTKPESINYSGINAYGLNMDMEKRASAKEDNSELIKEAEAAFHNAVLECGLKVGAGLHKIASLRKRAIYLMPSLEGKYEREYFSLIKEASSSEELLKIAEEMNSAIVQVDTNNSLKETLLEKKANIIGKAIAGTVGAAAGGAATVAGKGVGFVAAAPMKRGLNPLMYSAQLKHGADRAKNFAGTESHIGNVHLEKEASAPSFWGGVGEGVSQVFNGKNLGYLGAALGLVGVGSLVARKMGGVAGRMMEQRKLDEAFNNLQKKHQDIKENPQSRAYFDVVARHSPSLALDPMVAPQLIRQFDAFGGVDVNTVGKLREIEAKTQPSIPLKDDVGTFGTLTKNYQGFLPKP